MTKLCKSANGRHERNKMRRLKYILTFSATLNKATTLDLPYESRSPLGKPQNMICKYEGNI